MAETREEPARRFWTWLGVVTLLALGVRLGHVAALLHSPIGETLALDAAYYHQEALRLVGLLPAAADAGGVRFMNVGYPYLLALAYAAVGATPAAVLWVQALAGAATSGLLALAGRQVLRDDAAALVAGALYAVYAPAVFYDGLLLTPSLTNFFLAVALAGLARHLGRGAKGDLAWSGAALGVAIFLRSNLVLLLPPWLWAVVRRAGERAGESDGGPVRSRGQRAKQDPGERRGPAASALPAALLAAAALALPASVTLYHGAVDGEWVPLSANGGMNFWSGNHRGASGVYGATGMVETQNPAEERRVFLERARQRTGDPELTLAASSGFWFREGLREIRAAPVAWLGLEMRKLTLYWSRHEAKTNVSMPFVADFSPVLRWLPLGFGLLGVAGAGGIVWLFRNRRRAAAWLAAGPVLAGLATCLLFFVSGEYRHPASLGLCLGAAALGCELARRVAPRIRALLGRQPLADGRGGSPGPSRLAAALVVAVLLIPLAARVAPAQARAAHPFIDYSNYARALCTPRADGSRPERADFDRARALLDRADPERHPGKRLMLLDARLWVHTLAALELRDRAAAADALAAAQELLAAAQERAAAGPEGGTDGYSPAYLRELASSIRTRVAGLAGRPFVRDDPLLRPAAAGLLARLESAP